jgi:hypothetical protein
VAEGDTRAQLEIDPAIRRVEMKITARAKDEDEVLQALERAGVEAEAREVYFFDTGDLRLFESGVVLRARLVPGSFEDSTVEVRPVDPKTLAPRWKEHPDLEFAVDAVGDQYVSSARLSAQQNPGEVQSAARGERALRELFTADQEAFLTEHAPAGTAVDWDGLSVLGPVDVRKWEREPKDFPYEVTVEEWVLPDSSDLVEASIRVAPDEAVEANARFLDFLRARGFDTEGDAKTKTRTALEYFTGKRLA